MDHYNYQKTIQTLWQKGVEAYQSGQRGAASFYTDEEVSYLAANGITAQEIYDFVEDFVYGGEPDFATFFAITDVRRSYFLNQMGGQTTGKTIDPSTYPAKSEEIDGIVWLPRILQKAKTKLRGELDEDTMFGCGGDRRFFMTNNIFPAEFLRLVAENYDDEPAVIEWVKKRRTATA